MSDLVEKFFTPGDRKRIEEAVREAEEQTAGEIVVMAVSSSHHYPAANLVGGMSTGYLLALAAALFSGRDHMWDFTLFFVLFFILCNELIRRSWTLKRLFVRRSDMAEEVEEGALKSFYSKAVFDTVDHTGILIYISLFEHRVRIVADKGISAVVEQREWDDIVQHIVSGIREKRQAPAVVEAVRRCGAVLQRHVPARPGDRNELDDRMITRQ